MKIKVINSTKTVWSQETRQTDVKLDDGRILKVRQMEDDNGTESYFYIEGETKNWTNSYECEDDKLKSIIDKIAWNIFQNVFDNKDEIIDLSEIEEPLW
mgnify:CR=1 FL=1